MSFPFAPLSIAALISPAKSCLFDKTDGEIECLAETQICLNRCQKCDAAVIGQKLAIHIETVAEICCLVKLSL